MASVVDICNLALGHLGDEADVSSIFPSDQSAQADHCARFYPIARDALLEWHDWRFATRREALAEVDNDRTSWAYAYALPNGCLKPRSVLLPDATDDTATQNFVVETNTTGAQVIYTNAVSATLLFTVLVSDTTKFTPLFVVALARLLSSFLAGPIIKGETGMKVAQVQMSMFLKVEFPAATAGDSSARKLNPYDTFTPSGITARQ